MSSKIERTEGNCKKFTTFLKELTMHTFQLTMLRISLAYVYSWVIDILYNHNKQYKNIYTKSQNIIIHCPSHQWLC